jgi:hypothetical protein
MKNHVVEANVFAVLVLLSLIAIGIVLMFMPRRIQRIAAMDRWGPIAGPRVMRKYIESPQYIWHLRFFGALALVFAGMLFYDLLFH